MKSTSIQIADYFKDNKEIIAVYLYGSYSAGKQRPMSDVDVGIIIDQEKFSLAHITERRDRYMIGLSRILRKDIHLVILNIAGEGLLNQVFRKGNCILAKNKKKLTLFKARMLLRIADFNYHKNMMQTGFIRHVMEEKA